MPDALFRRDGDLFHPTGLTVGPWSPDAQHGGPPAALLSGAIEKTPSDVEMVTVRITVDLVRPVPIGPLRLTAAVVRPGRKVQLVAATLTHQGQDVARAMGLKIRQAENELPFGVADDAGIPGPELGRPAVMFDDAGAFAEEAMEIMMLEGDFSEPGPGRAWLRLRVPLVEGEVTTPLERVAAAADFGNGIGNLSGHIRDWIFINPDLEIRVARPPEGEWIYLESQTRVHPTGTGLATSTIADQRGWLGVAAQSLLVDVNNQA